MERRTSVINYIDDLDVERCYGDVFDDAALRAAMAGRERCLLLRGGGPDVTARPRPLIRTNVEGLRYVLDAALASDLHKLVFTSGTGTLAIHDHRPVTEGDRHNWDDGARFFAASSAD